MPDAVRHDRGYLEALERKLGGAAGTHEFGNFDLKPRLAREYDSASRAVHAAAVERSSDFNNRLALGRRSGDVGI
jgi:hypothetical protein